MKGIGVIHYRLMATRQSEKDSMNNVWMNIGISLS